MYKVKFWLRWHAGNILRIWGWLTKNHSVPSKYLRPCTVRRGDVKCVVTCRDVLRQLTFHSLKSCLRILLVTLRKTTINFSKDSWPMWLDLSIGPTNAKHDCYPPVADVVVSSLLSRTCDIHGTPGLSWDTFITIFVETVSYKKKQSLELDHRLILWNVLQIFRKYITYWRWEGLYIRSLWTFFMYKSDTLICINNGKNYSSSTNGACYII